MDRAQKSAAVAELNRTFTESGVVVVTRNLGLTVAQSTVLRVKMREAGASYKVCEEPPCPHRCRRHGLHLAQRSC